MVLAETVAGGVGDHTDKRWLFIERWANELGITGTDAESKINDLRGLACRRTSRHAERARQLRLEMLRGSGAPCRW
jgi:hypothetical protein